MSDIAVRDLIRYMPHRPPMVWIDRVREFSKVNGICLVDIRRDALYMGPSGLRASSCLEFVAQSFGFIWTCYVTRTLNPAAPPMTKALLVSFKDAHFAGAEIFRRVTEGEELSVVIENVRAVGPITAFRGVVSHRDDQLCEVQMRTYCE